MLTAKQQANLIDALRMELSMCALQHAEGWYVKDCITRGASRRNQCSRCRVLTRVKEAISTPTETTTSDRRADA